MPKIELREAQIEFEDRQSDFCQCGAVPHPEYEPHCLLCGMYWKDVDEGIFESWLEALEAEASRVGERP